MADTPRSAPMPLPLHSATLWLCSLSAPPTEIPGPMARANAIEVSDSMLVQMREALAPSKHRRKSAA